MPYVQDAKSFGRGSGQLTYSWRTGSHSQKGYDISSFPPVREHGENLGSYLARRNAWYGGVAEAAANSDRFQGHSLSRDSGHNFKRLKTEATSGSYQRYDPGYPTSPTATFSGPTALHSYLPSRACYDFERFFPVTLSSVTGNSMVGLPDFGGNSGATASLIRGAYNSMVPSDVYAGWGETVVELLRGNIPTLISNIGRRIDKGRKLDPKGTGRDLGSDYLNAQFGIIPIVRDIQSTIAHLMGMSQILYRTTKRSRTTETQYHNSKTDIGGTVWRNNRFPQGYTIPKWASNGLTITSSARLAAKFARVQPTVGALSFWDSAQEVTYNLGYNPKLTWDLLPYSWLIDWSGHIGRSIQSASTLSSGKVSTVYSWVSIRETAAASHRGFTYKERTYGSDIIHRASGASSLTTYFRREQISPFGVDFVMPTMSGYQWSILIALGLAKMPGKR